jgi:hypothetical protein
MIFFSCPLREILSTDQGEGMALVRVGNWGLAFPG